MGRSRVKHVAAERPGRIGGIVKLGRRRGAVLTSHDRHKTIGHQRRGVLRARDLERGRLHPSPCSGIVNLGGPNHVEIGIEASGHQDQPIGQ
jgi:hypothetical protein